MNKGITHQYPITGKEALMNEFLRGVETFGELLGPIFIQLHEKFSHRPALFKFLESLPAGYPFFLELRHPELVANSALYEYLHTKNIGAVITDAAGRRDAVHMHLAIRAKEACRYCRSIEWQTILLSPALKSQYIF